MKTHFLNIIFITILFNSCTTNSRKQDEQIELAKISYKHKMYLHITYYKTETIKMSKPNDYGKINFYSNQLYSIYNSSDDSVWLYLVNKAKNLKNITMYTKTLLCYNELFHYQEKNDFLMGQRPSNFEGYEKHDSIFLLPKKSFIFPMFDAYNSGLDSLAYELKIKIKKGSIYKDTLVRKKLRLYNNEKFIEDLEDWPSIKFN